MNALFRFALTNFETFPRSVKRGILEWITVAKKSQTRAKHIDETARLAAENVRADHGVVRPKIHATELLLDTSLYRPYPARFAFAVQTLTWWSKPHV